MVKVICVNTIETGRRDGVSGDLVKVVHEPGSTIEVEDHEVPRLLKLGAVRLLDAPDAQSLAS